MENQKYLDDLQDIRKMMNRSTQFLSLSGLSGVFAGTYALIGAWLANSLIRAEVEKDYYVRYRDFENLLFFKVAGIGLVVLLLSVVSALICTHLKARKNQESIWNATSKRLIVNFLIPLFAGGIFALILLRHSYFGLIAPVTLIFYGLACIQASKFTHRDVRYLGLTILVIGLFNAEYPGYGFECWSLGFGVCHIFYGAIMYFKYDRNS
ncbi:hypothetical protein [Flavobacterium sp.]|uniref:hypothetical protein n=1 Tax=Flavobacterium sp. TaxID=239 RepID=UPI0011F8041A|nr:hypothetical protein [Flavobacterium sp.]RZJ72993.1 MAG: hypothetical protein EOO49_05020 [Flavobacterium sp.]